MCLSGGSVPEKTANVSMAIVMSIAAEAGDSSTPATYPTPDAAKARPEYIASQLHHGPLGASNNHVLAKSRADQPTISKSVAIRPTANAEADTPAATSRRTNATVFEKSPAPAIPEAVPAAASA